ncbi:hypothetical protein BGZ96_001719 [Linnemannia gamsii]|uniref:Uncharacterized protein n=1 Tax=Linnemannia gamsii TaxID=64522 RepID=A0ABQ7KG96_9FUNG|nr:hypothetical protein BGZ96_001719 [Linnemannia gamsii]
MYTRNLVSLVLLALCALCSFSSVFAAPPPPPATDIIVVTSPKEGTNYKVGDQIHVKVKLPGGKKNILYIHNTPVKLIIQKRIPKPNLNKDIAFVPARILATKGYSFKALEEYIIDTQKTVAWRVRTHFDQGDKSGYSDSQGFYIKK